MTPSADVGLLDSRFSADRFPQGDIFTLAHSIRSYRYLYAGFVSLKEKVMTSVELRNNFHHLIDSIGNDRILSKFYSVMLNINDTKDGIYWSRLTQEEQDELIQADIESSNPSNLIPHTEVSHKHKKWL